MAVVDHRVARAWTAIAFFVVLLACSPRTERAAEESGPAAAAGPRPSPPAVDTAARPTRAADTSPVVARSPAPARPAPGFRFDADIGVVQSAREGSLCLAIASADLAPGDTLLAVSADRPQGIAVVRIDARRANPCTLPGDEWGSVSIERASFYNVTLRIVQSPFSDPTIAFRSNARLRLDGDVVTGDLDGDGRPERFAQCTSREGIHLRVMTTAANAEIERWHQYYYVPYDLEPNCPGS